MPEPYSTPALPANPADKGRRTTIIAIFAITAILVAGGAYYLFAIYLPKQNLGPAQEEIARWEERLAAARACVLGKQSLAVPPREALAIRRASLDPWGGDRCGKVLGALSRGEAEDTGIAELEEAWRAINSAAGGLATTFVTELDPRRNVAPKLESIAIALDVLAGAHARLRAAADLPPAPEPPATAQLPKAQVIDLELGALIDASLPTLGRITGFGRRRAGAGSVQVELVAGAPPVIRPVGDGTIRAIPEAGWGAAGFLGGIAVGPIDDAGRVPIPDRTSAPGVFKVAGRGLVVAATGTAADGTVLGGGDDGLVLIRAQGGKRTADKPIPISEMAFAVDPTGRTLVAYVNDEGTVFGSISRAGLPPKWLELGEGRSDRACLTARRAWVNGGGHKTFFSFDEAATIAPHLYDDHVLVGCGSEAALLRHATGSGYVVCGAECRTARLDSAPRADLVTLAGERVVGVAVSDTVLVVWSERGAPAYHSIPEGASPQFVLSDGAVIDVIARRGDGLSVLRVPAPK